MGTLHILLLILVAAGISVGQLLFKIAANKLTGESIFDIATRMFIDPYVLSALLIYLLITIIWMWILTEVPLSKAYPFVVLSYIFTPFLAAIFLYESITASYVIGVCLICSGLFIITKFGLPDIS
jgi:drug/metabolite transporter (DMT)-like permease